MFHPPTSGRLQRFDAPQIAYQEASPLTGERPPTTPIPNTPVPHTPALGTKRRKSKSPTRNRIVPRDEDIRRLFQECKLGQGNASLLSQALALSAPEDLKKKEVIKVGTITISTAGDNT